MTDKITGSCLCGAVRYEITGKPEMMGRCHCRDCQKATGSAYFPMVAAFKEKIKITGEYKEHEKPGDSGKCVRRYFCKICGSMVFDHSDAFPHILAVFAGTLDKPELFKPVMDIWTSSAQHWDVLDKKSLKFAKNPGLAVRVFGAVYSFLSKPIDKIKYSLERKNINATAEGE